LTMKANVLYNKSRIRDLRIKYFGSLKGSNE
jgi:hypothetical protein